MPFPRIPLLVRPLGAVIAAVVVAALAPGRAAASCGDYVHIANGQPGTERHPAPVDADHPLSPKPCHGPGCSKKPTTPVLPITPPPTVSTGTERCVPEPLADLDPAAGRGWVATPLDAGSPVSLARAIFHPPRPSLV